MNIIVKPYESSLNELVFIDQLLLELQEHEHQFDSRKSVDMKNVAAYRTELLETIRTKKGELLLAYSNENIIGLLSWFIEDEPEFNQPYGYISDLVVLSEFRNQGIGKQLLGTAIEHIKSRSITRIHIGVMVDNIQTKVLYEKLGFAAYTLKMTMDITKPS